MSFLIKNKISETIIYGKEGILRFYEKQYSSHKKKVQNNHIYSLQEIFSMCFPTGMEGFSGRTFLQISLRIGRRAGMVVEAALLLPLFLLAMFTMISFMDIYSLQTERITELCQTVKAAGMYAFVTGAEEDTEIGLPAIYSYQVPFSVIPLPKLWMMNEVKVRAWTGALYIEETDAQKTPMVYVTENGSVYHAKHCSYLNPSVQQVSGSELENLRNQSNGKYYACEKCSQGQNPGAFVYITRNGTRYHNSFFCSSLKRLSRMVKLADVQSKMSPCSKCKGG